jgi:transposase
MYLRRISRKNKNGSETAYLQLAHNEWDPQARCAKAKVIYSFGREDELDRAALKRLVESISRYLAPGEAIRAQGSAGRTDIEYVSSRSFGGVWALEGLWKQLGMAKLISQLFRGKERHANLERLLFAMVANRALSPSSKLAMEDWVKDDAYIEGLPSLNSDQLYRAMDELLGVKDGLEEQVYWAAADLMNLEVDLLYFDTTSSYFEVEGSEIPEGDALRKPGYSKDKRPDLAQVVIGMAVTREGIPVRSWVWPGNTADMSVVEEVKRDLVGWKLGRVISVMDRGFSSEENLRTLQRTGGHYIVGEKMRSGKPETEEALSKGGRYHRIRDNLQVKEILIGDGEGRRRLLLAFNPREAEKQRKEREAILKALAEELGSIRQLPDALHTKAMCRLRTHGLYSKYLTQLKDGTLKISQAAVREAERYDGKYLIRTSDDTLSSEDAVLGYKQLADVEDAFRTLKTTLVLRPMYHRLEDRIRSHILLCWLALLLVRVAEVRTGDSWRNIRRELERLHIGFFKSRDGSFYQTTNLTSNQSTILKGLGVEKPPKLLQIATNP